MPFAFNKVKLCVATINEKPWARDWEVRKTLEYNKKAADIVKAFYSRENYAHKWQLNKFPAAENVMDWPKDLREDDYYINEERMKEIVFSSQQPKAKDHRGHCCNVLFPYFRQQLTNKIQEEHQQAITDCDNQIQAHQQKILRLNEDIDDLINNRHVARH